MHQITRVNGISDQRRLDCSLYFTHSDVILSNIRQFLLLGYTVFAKFLEGCKFHSFHGYLSNHQVLVLKNFSTTASFLAFI